MSERSLRYLARKINRAYEKESFECFLVVGEMGRGKTSFALHLAREVLGNWDVVLNYLFFDVTQALQVMYNSLINGRRLKIIILDDFGLWGSSLDWFESDKRAFVRFYNVIRECVSSVVITSPLPQDILKRIREKSMYKVQVDFDPECKDYSIARIYREKYDVGTNMFYRKMIAIIRYPRHYPDEVYKQYKIMRRSATILALQNVMNLVHSTSSLEVLIWKMHNAGLSIRKIAGILNMDRNAVWRRLKKMRKRHEMMKLKTSIETL